MPLDRANGEVLDGFHGSLHVVVSARALAEMTNVLTEYQVKSKFRPRVLHRPIFDDAVAHAIDAYALAGALRPIRFDDDDVLVQVYPKEMKAAVMFQRVVAGKEMFVTRFYDLPQPVVDSLISTTGKAIREH